jgi:hypothetical protein
MAPRRITPIALLVIASLIPGLAAGKETETGLIQELSRYVDLKEEPCPPDEVEELLAAGFNMICASTGLEFKDFRKQWRKAQKRLDIVDVMETASWDKIPSGGMRQVFWMQNREAIILVNQGQVRFLKELGMEPCGPDSPYDRPDESIALPQWKPEAMELYQGLPLPTHQGTVVWVRARILEDGRADVVCIYDMSQKMRLFNTVAHGIVEASDFEPALRDGAPLPWIMDVEVMFPENFADGKIKRDDIPHWFIRSISPVRRP